MALQSSGAISLANLATEFPDTTPHSLSEFYRGGGKVPDAAANSAVPTSGAISLGNFYGAVNRVAINITISSNQTNYVLNTAKASGYVAGVSDITLTINSGVYVSSSTIGGRALDVDTSWATGDTISIVNNGFIVGMGGSGGAGHGASPGSAGGSGGLAFRAQRPVSINNAGTIAGGGGGGGGGQSRGYYNKSTAYIVTGGGGGGGGRSSASSSSGGAGGTQVFGIPNNDGNAGANGTSSSAGGGGSGKVSTLFSPTYNSGKGGDGGGWGAAGATGSTSSGNGQSMGGPSGGGAAGAAVSGNSNITWIATGTRLGAIA